MVVSTERYKLVVCLKHTHTQNRRIIRIQLTRNWCFNNMWKMVIIFLKLRGEHSKRNWNHLCCVWITTTHYIQYIKYYTQTRLHDKMLKDLVQTWNLRQSLSDKKTNCFFFQVSPFFAPKANSLKRTDEPKFSWKVSWIGQVFSQGIGIRWPPASQIGNLPHFLGWK